jgi:hypothetical protein
MILAVLKITRAKAQNNIFVASALNITGTGVAASHHAFEQAELTLWQLRPSSACVFAIVVTRHA